MTCQNIKKILSEYLDGELKAKEAQFVREHLEVCIHCQNELKLLEQFWQMLLSWKDKEPAAGYVARFWARLTSETSWHQRFLLDIREVFAHRTLAPVMISVSMLVLIGFVYLQNDLRNRSAEKILSKMNPEDIEFVEHFDLVKHYDMIENLDVIEDLDVVENLDSLDS